MQDRGRDKMARPGFNKPAAAAPAMPGLRSVRYVGSIGGQTITPGDVVRLDPAVRKGVVKIGAEFHVSAATFHRIRHGLTGFVEI